MVDPNRKINRLNEKDIEFLDECEEEFKDRYTDYDEEFVKHCKAGLPKPPTVESWNLNKNFQNDDNRSSGGYRGRHNRNSYNQRNFHHSGHHRGRYNDRRNHPYQRNRNNERRFDFKYD